MYLYRFFNLYLYLYLSLYLVVLSSKYSNTSATFAHLNRSTDVDHVRWTCGRVSAPLSLNGNSLNFSRRQRVGVKFNANVLEPLLCSSVLKLGKQFQKIYVQYAYICLNKIWFIFYISNVFLRTVLCSTVLETVSSFTIRDELRICGLRAQLFGGCL